MFSGDVDVCSVIFGGWTFGLFDLEIFRVDGNGVVLTQIRG